MEQMRNRKIKITKGTDGEIAVVLPYNPIYIKNLKSIKGHRWDPEQKRWIFPYSDKTVNRIIDLFENKDVWIDSSLKQEKESKTLFEDLRRELMSRKYSPRTVKAHIYCNKNFLEFTVKSAENITEKDIKSYLFHLVDEKKVSTSTLNSAINALKFYYGSVLNREFLYEIKRPKKDKTLPVVLNRKEVSKILIAPSNIKHRAVLMLIYSAGLRVGR